MAKRNMIQVNLIKNSIAAYLAAIELHNKPNISYRYETVVLLIIDAWELALKAFIKKYIRNRSIFLPNMHTISLDTAISYVNEFINSSSPKSFTSKSENIRALEEYRNNFAHYYCDNIEPYIFMLIARAALNYVEFMRNYFGRDVLAEDGLFILPLGFKLPFSPEDYLSRNVAKYASSQEAQKFIDHIVKSISNLKEAGIDESIVLGFNVYFESVKKSTNSSILAAITSSEENAVQITRPTTMRLSNDPTAQPVYLSDEDFFREWKYPHVEVIKWCKSNIPDFRAGSIFNDIKKSLKSDIRFVNKRRLDSRNSKSPSQDFYSDAALMKIKDEYCRRISSKDIIL